MQIVPLAQQLIFKLLGEIVKKMVDKWKQKDYRIVNSIVKCEEQEMTFL